MGEHNPDSIERYREEMVCKKTGRWCYAAGTRLLTYNESGNWNENKRTNPERRDTGPFTHSPPHSKYLKQPVCNTCSSSSRGMRNEDRARKAKANDTHHPHRTNHTMQH